jgi:membrane-bound ClpP family serine protease
MGEKADRPTLGIVVKYFLLQLPGQLSLALILILFRQWVEIPAYLTWALIGFWIGKDIFLFPFLWRFYDPNQYPNRFRMVGRKGLALTLLNPGGYVRVRGERWQAYIAAGQAPIDKGEAICVEAVNGLRLTVRPCADDQRR